MFENFEEKNLGEHPNPKAELSMPNILFWPGLGGEKDSHLIQIIWEGPLYVHSKVNSSYPQKRTLTLDSLH